MATLFDKYISNAGLKAGHKYITVPGVGQLNIARLGSTDKAKINKLKELIKQRGATQ